MGRRVIVCGGRDYDDAGVVDWALSRLTCPDDVVVDGQCPDGGADELAHQWATAHGFDTDRFPARWDTEGRAAGPIRNRRMANAGADLVVAFPGGRGTRDMVAVARERGIEVVRVAG